MIEDRRITRTSRGKRRLRHAFNDIIAVQNLLTSWEDFLPGKRFRPDVADFSFSFMDTILELHRDLKAQVYRHGQYKRFTIHDPKSRVIHKASVRDRLVHHAVHRVLYPHFDSRFIFDSYSSRKGKGTHRALERFQVFSRKVSRNNTRTAWVLKCDVRKFFDSIDHQRLQEILRSHIDDDQLLWLLGQIISSFSLLSFHGKKEQSLRQGLPLGNLTSQLLVNIYMNELDQFVKHTLKAPYYIRYADDFVLLHEDKEYLRHSLLEIEAFLFQKLHLSLHPDKVTLVTLASGVDFLGWVHFPHHRVLRTVTKKRMFRKVQKAKERDLLGSDAGILTGILKEENSKSSRKPGAALQRTLASYNGLLSHGNAYKNLVKLTRSSLL